MSDQPPMGVQPPGKVMGLGGSWRPGAAGFRWAELQRGDGQKIQVLIFETEAGSFGVALSDEALRNLARQALERASGLTLAAPAVKLPRNGRPAPPG